MGGDEDSGSNEKKARIDVFLTITEDNLMKNYRDLSYTVLVDVNHLCRMNNCWAR